MAHIEIRPEEHICRLLLNGMDVSYEIYQGSLAFEVVGDDPVSQELGVRMTFALSSLTAGDAVFKGTPPGGLRGLREELQALVDSIPEGED